MTEIKKDRKSAAAYVDFGYAQVEPNHLSAQRTGQIYAQLPLADNLSQVENGQFVKYDYANLTDEGVADPRVNLSGDGEWMLVFNEVKPYDARETAADYVMDSAAFGRPVPRVFKTNVGDIMTTNAINSNAGDITVGKELTVGNDGFLKVDAEPGAGMIWQVAKVYDLADGQPAAKIIRIQ